MSTTVPAFHGTEDELVAAKLPRDAELRFESAPFAEDFNRRPLALSHNLSELDLFLPAALLSLARKYSGHPMDSFVAAGAPSANAAFNSVPHGQYAADVAMGLLDEKPFRVLLKRPENHDAGFRELIDKLFHSIADARGGFGSEKIMRLESSTFVSSAKTTTPIHFDPEVGFFCQIRGEKTYHVYPPTDLTEAELEPFYIKSSVEIGSVNVDDRDPASERIFYLGPGNGLHQPQNSPHWVETGSSLSISYSVVLETDVTQALALKSQAMNAVIPVRKLTGSLIRGIRRK
jgi:hypothetical protein